MSPLKLSDIKVWLNSKLTAMNKKMAPDAVEHLLGALSLMPQISLGFLDNELEKLALYSSGRVITLDDAEQVLASIPEVSVFAMIDALSQKQTAKALELLNEQLAAGDHPLRILALLVRQVRMLWQAKELTGQSIGGRTLAATLGVPPFIGEKIARQSRIFSSNSLKQALLALAVADFELKVGKADSTAIEKIIIEMCI
jgi:DNA polymerase-3 subunit delta